MRIGSLEIDLEKAGQAAQEAALAARQVLLKHFGDLRSIRSKDREGLVTEADEASERIIKEALLDFFPESIFLGEEESHRDGIDLHSFRSKGLCWIVDPLDGTTNYVHGFPIFCSSIALVADGQTVLGRVDAPVLDETFSAVVGKGSFRNAEPIRASETRSFDEALVATGLFAETEEQLEYQLRLLSQMMQTTRGIRRPGAAAYDLCLVASGVFDFFWEKNLKPWDTAAGALIVREAGGMVWNYEKQEHDPFHRSIIASNAQLIEEGYHLLHPKS